MCRHDSYRGVNPDAHFNTFERQPSPLQRVTTAPSRRAEQEKIRLEKEAALGEQEKIRAEREAARVAEREASEKAERDEVIRVRAEAARGKRGEELARGNRQFIGLFVVVTALVLFVVF